MEKRLLIFNGDHAWHCREKTVGKTEESILVWRENYLEGPLPAEGDIAAFERCRAAFLHTCVPEYSEERLFASLMGNHSMLQKFDSPECEIILYFDCCMYDMIMLSRIVSLLKESQALIRLFCEDVILSGAPWVFRKEYSSLRELTSEDKEVYAHTWASVLGGAEAVAEFNRRDVAAGEPFLKCAMERYAEDHPCDNSMGRSRRQLVEIVRSGISAFPEIFKSFDKYETYMFMGDTTCLRLLEDLVRKGVIRKQPPAEQGEYPSFFPK